MLVSNKRKMVAWAGCLGKRVQRPEPRMEASRTWILVPHGGVVALNAAGVSRYGESGAVCRGPRVGSAALMSTVQGVQGVS